MDQQTGKMFVLHASVMYRVTCTDDLSCRVLSLMYHVGCTGDLSWVLLSVMYILVTCFRSCRYCMCCQ